MKRVYAALAALCFTVSLIVGVAVPAQSQDMTPTFDDGEAYAHPVEAMFGSADTLTYNLWPTKAKISRSTRLLVITEPGWCPPCKNLEPILVTLKKEGYDVHRYTQSQWVKANPKPAGVPEKIRTEGSKVRVPTLLFVLADKKTNTVLHWKRGWQKSKDDAQYIKRYLTK